MTATAIAMGMATRATFGQAANEAAASRTPINADGETFAQAAARLPLGNASQNAASTIPIRTSMPTQTVVPQSDCQRTIPVLRQTTDSRPITLR